MTNCEIVLHGDGRMQWLINDELIWIEQLTFGAVRRIYEAALNARTVEDAARVHHLILKSAGVEIEFDDLPCWVTRVEHVGQILDHIMNVPVGPWSGVSKGGAPKETNPAVMTWEVGVRFGPIYKALGQSGVSPGEVDKCYVWQVAWMCGVDEMPTEEEMVEARKEASKERLRQQIKDRQAGIPLTHAEPARPSISPADFFKDLED